MIDNDNTYNYFSQAVQCAGHLPVGSTLYVKRDADTKIYQSIIKYYESSYGKQIFYVLAPRQTGKSSLMYYTIGKLSQFDLTCIEINIQGWGLADTEAKFYNTLARKICQNIELEKNIDYLKDWEIFWESNKSKSYPVAVLFTDYFENFFIKNRNFKLIIFLDEIQDIISWGIQESFFGFIQSITSNSKLKNLIIVLLGVISSNDLIPSNSTCFNRAENIELINFTYDQCKCLLPGLRNSSQAPEMVLREILYWTGGQPFLTLLVCDLVAKNLKIDKEVEIKKEIKKIVQESIIKTSLSQDKQIHFSSIKESFTKNSINKQKLISSIKIYKKIFTNNTKVFFDATIESIVHLTISGLVAKSEDCLIIANPIYKKVFNLKWIEQTLDFLKQKDNNMSNLKLLNRDVYVLIDRSESMNIIDDKLLELSRWELLVGENLRGDIRKILGYKKQIDNKEEKICSSIKVFLFSRNRVGYNFEIETIEDLNKNFEGLEPDSTSIIFPTLKHCIDDWLGNGHQHGKNALILIYSDGQLTDTKKFQMLISETCKELEDQDELKIIMIGFGKDAIENRDYYEKLDTNLQSNKDKNGKECDIFGFAMVDEMEDIIDVITQEIEGLH